MLLIPIGFNADPDPDFYSNADPEPGSQTNSDPYKSGSWSDFAVNKCWIFTCIAALLIPQASVADTAPQKFWKQDTDPHTQPIQNHPLWFKTEQRAVDAHNEGVEAQKGAVQGL